MTRLLRSLVLSAAVAATTLAATAQPQAGERHRGWHRPPPVAQDRGDDLLAAGILGFAAGAAVAAILAQQERPRPVYRNPYRQPRPSAERHYFPPAPGRHAAAPGHSAEPWSRAWERRCARRHPGFDPASGTYAGADGRRYFCRG
ncbi:BA14K family protein [Aquibium sp. A9E412]|uniref:BA14K family protein n=1 Tax=Aquibium sp. A9E412 TaxID=2976767 RepID=UPI0025B0BA37|nr:BA14K family protein [Aquibium sp. A9E412]MDN2567953.1 BA14K family protein [Aquibium sp. A9E412]